MKQNNKLILLTILLLCISCGRTYREEDLTQTTLTKEDSLKIREQQIKENLEKTNQIVINKEKERILSYIKRNAWQTKEIDGVFIEILKQSKGKKIQQGKRQSNPNQWGLCNNYKRIRKRWTRHCLPSRSEQPNDGTQMVSQPYER